MSASARSEERPRPARILLVEDNPADVRLTREMFRESKVRNDLFVGADAEEAERMLGLGGEKATEERPDLVLFDLNLPGKSGHELLEEIKTHPELRRIPVAMPYRLPARQSSPASGGRSRTGSRAIFQAHGDVPDASDATRHGSDSSMSVAGTSPHAL